MTQQADSGAGTSGAYEGKDFICHTCGCEIMVKHWGDPPAHDQTGVFLCHCGTIMEPEHARGQDGSGTREGTFNQDDFLSQGSGVGGPGAGG